MGNELHNKKTNPVSFVAMVCLSKNLPNLFRIISLASQITENGVKTLFKLTQKSVFFFGADAVY